MAATTTTSANPKVDFYFKKNNKWQEETELLRTIALGCGLTEELKWGVPCYTSNDVNIILIHDFKAYCAFLFFKGALLADKEKILVQQTKNVQAARQIRFTSAGQIADMKPMLKAYINEAIKVETSGLKVDMKTTEEFSMPEEFQNKLDDMPDLKKAFAALTPGRQRAYLLYFSAPKQPKTRTARIEKSIPSILNGKGLND